MAAPTVTQYCIVCGQGSTRHDWRNTQDGFVACDRHTKEEITQAIARNKAGQDPVSVKKAVPGSVPAGQTSKAPPVTQATPPPVKLGVPAATATPPGARTPGQSATPSLTPPVPAGTPTDVGTGAPVVSDTDAQADPTKQNANVNTKSRSAS